MKYVAVILVVSAVVATVSFLFWKTENEPEFTGNFGTSNTQFRNTDTKNLSPYAMFGDSSLVMMTEEEKNGKHFIDIPYGEKSSDIQWIRFEPRLGVVSFLDKNHQEIGRVILPPKALARFLSTDPRADKYPELSPYNFVAGNPITNIDPNGDTIKVRFADPTTSTIYEVFYKDGALYNMDGSEYEFQETNILFNFDTEVLAALTKLDLLGGETGHNLITELVSSANTTTISYSKRNAADMTNGKYVGWNLSSSGGLNTEGSLNRPSFIALGHELAHVQDIWNGTIDMGKWIDLPVTNGTKTIPRAELYATHMENKL